MKDVVNGVVLYLVLSLLFSLTSFPEDIFPPLGNIGIHPGDSGTVVPGGGSDIAEFTVTAEMQRPTEQEESEEPKDPGKTEGKKPSEEPKKAEASASGDASETESQIPIDIEIKEKNKMDEILLAFWHGVATVLIGETVALMVAIAWLKIKKGDMDGK